MPTVTEQLVINAAVNAEALRVQIADAIARREKNLLGGDAVTLLQRALLAEEQALAAAVATYNAA